ncbi:restriction endonuclease subunit S [Chishuiella sp.]|uniref:restriction endonuclease subunit S n=1 Tax=Chishuiella sp. TaxID=1969467 RepID=UPI0028A9D132|nr:restriction endonuclease subunit S [Chishuiella sp.]
MEFKSYKLSQLVKRKKVSAKIEPEKLYKRVTVKLYHKGVIQRDEELGVNIKSSMFYVSSGDFILSGIDARNGAFGIVPEELEGAIITNDFWCLEPNAELLNKEFFLFLTSTSFFDYICKICSDGTTQRIRLQKDKFFDFEISIPSVKNQLILVEKLKLVNSVGSNISSEINHQLDLIKDLRQAFLREAMQGVLVSNETQNGATGADLLVEIQAEKAQLVKEKKIKKGKLQEAEMLEGLMFNVPENWIWSKLDDLTVYITDGTHQTPNYTEKGRIFLSAQNVKPFKFKPELHRFVSEEDYQNYILNRTPEKGDLLVARVGAGIGETAVIDRDIEFAFYVSLGLVKPFKSHLSSEYLAYVFNSPYGVKYAKGNISSKGGSAGNFNLGRIRSFLIPLPPLEIQERIVAKLDELMAVCDALETQVKQSQLTNEQLLQQVLREALGA